MENFNTKKFNVRSAKRLNRKSDLLKTSSARGLGLTATTFLLFLWWASLAFTAGGVVPVVSADFDEIQQKFTSSTPSEESSDMEMMNSLKNRLEGHAGMSDDSKDWMIEKIEEMMYGDRDSICCDSDIMNALRDRLGDKFENYRSVLCGTCDPKISVSLEADPDKVVKGGSSTLTWDSKHAKSCTSDDFNIESGATFGSISVNVHEDTKFTVSCEDDRGKVKEDSVTVKVIESGDAGRCPDGYEKIYDDMEGSLSWTSDDHYTSVILVGGPIDDDNNKDPDGRNKKFSDVYKGDTIQRVEHDISHICAISFEGYAPTVELSAYPNQVVKGKSSTLTWDSEYANSCTSDDFSIEDGATEGSVVVTPTKTTVYEITCEGEGGSATDTAKVTVTDDGKTGSITVCKMFSDEEGNVIIDSDDLPYGDFSIDLYEELELKNKVGSLDLLAEEFTPNTSILNNHEYDAYCKTFTGLELNTGGVDHRTDGYFYPEETVVGDSWKEPKYNDQFSVSLQSLSNFLPYSPELFEADNPNDEHSRNLNSDGHIVLSEGRPNRTLVVLNSFEKKEVEEYATVYAHKIVCGDESEMPNYGKGGPNITKDTASQWVKDNESCELVPGWKFQWAPKGTNNPDNPPYNPLYGEAGDPWKTFGSIGADGKATLKLTAGDIEGIDYIWVREVLQTGYIPFTYGPNNTTNNDNYSAEMYCHEDVLNFDNYDRVDNISVGNTYHCVAWNMLEDDIDICLVPDNLGDEDRVVFGKSYGQEPSLQSILNQKGFDIDVDEDQKNYQVWHADENTTVKFTVEFLAAYAGNSNVFGYYVDGDIDTFEPLFKNKDHSDFPDTQKASAGDHVSVEVFGAEKIAFAIHTEGSGIKDVWATENGLNKDDMRLVVVYDGEGIEEYILAFEDLEGLGDSDFNDMVVKVVIDECPVFESIVPTVTVDADPIKVDKGDSSVISWDSEDAVSCYSEDFETDGKTSGTTTVTVNQDTTYTVTCESSTGHTDSDSVTVTVEDEKAVIPTVELSADPTKVEKGDETVLTWSSDNAETCVGENFNTNDATSGSTTVNVGQKTVFKVVCESNTGHKANASVTVDIEPAPTPTRRSSRGSYVRASSVTLNITNERIREIVDESTVIIAWDTNISASSQVVYGTESISRGDLDMSVDTLGYENATMESTRDTRLHNLAVEGLEIGRTYYFRPVSRVDGQVAVGNELTFTPREAVGEVPVDYDCIYLKDYLRIDFNNDPIEVYKLQVFLNEYENIYTPVNGVFDRATYNSVVTFQERYFDDVLAPWGHTAGTGYVYITTKKKINEIVCQENIAFTLSQSAEIRQFRAFMDSLSHQGVTPPFTREEMERIRDEFDGDVDDFIREEVGPDGDEPTYHIEEMEIGFEDTDAEVEVDREREGLLAAAGTAFFNLPKTLGGAFQAVVMLILSLLLIYLLTLLFVPLSDIDGPRVEQGKSFKRATLFSVFTLIAVLLSVTAPVGVLTLPLVVVFIISVIVVFFKLINSDRPINQELDLEK